jgi:hypothetical protein
VGVTFVTLFSLALVSFIVGAVLAMQFKVWVLIPAFALVTVPAVGIGIASGNTGGIVLVSAVTAATCLQIGYFVGIGVDNFLKRIASKRATALPSPQIRRHAYPERSFTAAADARLIREEHCRF